MMFPDLDHVQDETIAMYSQELLNSYIKFAEDVLTDTNQGHETMVKVISYGMLHAYKHGAVNERIRKANEPRIIVF